MEGLLIIINHTYWILQSRSITLPNFQLFFPVTVRLESFFNFAAFDFSESSNIHCTDKITLFVFSAIYGLSIKSFQIFEITPETSNIWFLYFSSAWISFASYSAKRSLAFIFIAFCIISVFWITIPVLDTVLFFVLLKLQLNHIRKTTQRNVRILCRLNQFHCFVLQNWHTFASNGISALHSRHFFVLFSIKRRVKKEIKDKQKGQTIAFDVCLEHSDTFMLEYKNGTGKIICPYLNSNIKKMSRDVF